MKKQILTLVAIGMIAIFSNNLMAQTEATVTGTTAGAVLIVPMSLTQTAPLHFGSSVLTGVTGGTVVLPSNSVTRVYTGDVATSAAAPAPTNAAYSVTGTAAETYALTLPGTVTVTHTNATDNMIISALTARFIGAGADAVTSTLSATGTDSFTVGGTLTVKSTSIGGVYAGTFDVSVDYN